MDLIEVEKLFEKYNIQTLEELEYYLDIDNAKDDCIDDPDEDKNCTNANCYESTFVPDCRKIIEIYNKYFKNDMHRKKSFINYLVERTSKSNSSIENYLSCKSCNQQMAKSINNSLKISATEFKKDFCFNLDKKFNYISLFETDYISIKQFLFKEHEITKENFKPIFTEEKSMLTVKEEEKIFDLTHVSKKELQSNLSDMNNIKGSNSYKMNLALAAFNRNLLDESFEIVDMLSSENEFQNNQELLQLQAKILSSKKQDKDAIVILSELVEMTKPNINTEANNLLAASIKRNAFYEFTLYSDEEKLVEELLEAKDIYFSVYKLNNDYYPALNYMYLESMLTYIQQGNGESIKAVRERFNAIWSGLNHRVNDWWSYIASIEYLILLGEYDEALSELKLHFNSIEEFEINDFNLSSTIRQLELYVNFCSDSGLNNIIAFLKDRLPDN